MTIPQAITGALTCCTGLFLLSAAFALVSWGVRQWRADD